MTQGRVHFVHGKESGPRGSKIAALASVAQARHWAVASLDYSHTTDPAVRLEQLLGACANLDLPLVLVGSSMGGWVAAEAAERLGARGQGDHRLNTRIPLLRELFDAFLARCAA